MAKAYCGVGGRARRIRRMYYGSGSTAKRVKRVYIGVNGVARLVYLHPAAEDLSVARYGVAGATTGNHAIFAGGYSDAMESYHCHLDAVDCYDRFLVKHQISQLSVSRNNHAAVGIGEYALFGGGARFENLTYTRIGTVEAYSGNLIRLNAPDLSKIRSELLAATADASKAFFAGGFDNNTDYSSVVDSYTASLVRTTLSSGLSLARNPWASASLGAFALFAGGGDYSKVVDAFNSNMVRTIPAQCGQAPMSALQTSEFVVFTTNQLGYNEVYNTSLVKTGPITFTHDPGKSVHVGNKAVFLTSDRFVGILLPNLVQSYRRNADYAGYHRNGASASINDIAYFAGGFDDRSAITAKVTYID